MSIRHEELLGALATARGRLLEERAGKTHWRGRLSDSALSTATALAALAMSDAERHRERIERALDWLEQTRNPDGGWGDTVRSRSNISTTWLVHAAFVIAGASGRACLDACRQYLEAQGGPRAVIERYGADRTFSAPILSMLATAGLCEWKECPALPFQLAALPRSLFPWVGLRVVSYALPALIAVGLAISVQTHAPAGGGAFVRRWLADRVLRQLDSITPESGGYLEAIPLTAFVAINLINSGHGGRPVLARNIAFLLAQQRPEGAWPIDQDLAVWMTTLSVQALGEADAAVRDWILDRQTRRKHPYTGAAAGGWGWTDASGSVPDGDDTAGALLALGRLPVCDRTLEAVDRGTAWLLGLQNGDGGWPTFCRGWHHLPFDQSCPDLTAHALRALQHWQTRHDGFSDPRSRRAVLRGFRYLESSQQADGSWFPLWFGNEAAPAERNPVLGTSRVLLAWADGAKEDHPACRRGKGYLLGAQNPDGSWGGAAGVAGSIEETALACEALGRFSPEGSLTGPWAKGLAWLCGRIREGGLEEPAPLGLYFANLWYFERLYPIIFAAGALRQAVERSAPGKQTA